MTSLLIFTDGGSRGNPGQAATGVFVTDQSGTVIEEQGLAIGIATNNVAEYAALISAIEWASGYCTNRAVEQITFHLDSKLVVEQINGNWKVKQSHIFPLVQRAQTLLKALPCPTKIIYVPRAQNAEADRLVNQALDSIQS